MSTETKIGSLHAGAGARTGAGEKTVFKVLLAISFCHLLNDTVQSLLPAIYPLLRNTFHLDFSQVGLLTLSIAPSYGTVLVAAALVGMGSSVFHPESSRVARMASGGQHGMAQSLFQVGGNAGSALGPLLATIVLPRGQRSIAWFSFLALLAMVLLADIGAWAKKRRAMQAELHAVPLAAHALPAHAE